MAQRQQPAPAQRVVLQELQQELLPLLHGERFNLMHLFFLVHSAFHSSSQDLMSSYSSCACFSVIDPVSRV